MEPLLEALYNYALKYRFDGYFLPDEDERRENETMVRLAREELSAKGLGDAAERLEDGLMILRHLDRQSAFRAGLAIGMDLHRL